MGYITTSTGTATGFRVGDCYMMTAYHVFRQNIGKIIVHVVDLSSYQINNKTSEFNK